MIKYKCKDKFDITGIVEVEGRLFVCQDKNGKDVFADDKMRSKDGLRKYKVTWNDRRCCWYLSGLGETWAVNNPVWSKYELIENKEDETT